MFLKIITKMLTYTTVQTFLQIGDREGIEAHIKE